MSDREVRAKPALNLTTLGGLLVAAPILMIVAGLWVVALYSGSIPVDVIESITLWAVTVGVVALLIGRVTLRKRVAAMVEIAYAARAIADGRMNVPVPETARMDELGEMARAVAFTRSRITALHQQIEENDDSDEARQFEQSAMRLVQSRAVLAETVTEAARIAGGLKDNTTLLSGQINRLIADAQSARDASNQGSITISELAAAVDQITRAVVEINGQATESAQMVRLASQAGIEVTVQVGQLAEAVRRVDSVVTSIRAIAEQTNLLALNATIEASRAGDAGRGFAVVAAEVKSLATETAKATSEITALVRSIQEVTQSAAVAAQGITGRLDAVEQSSRVISSAIGEQEAATKEIARSSTSAARHSLAAHQHFQAIEKTVLAAGSGVARLEDETTRLIATSGRVETEMERLFEGLRTVRGNGLSLQDAA